MKNPAIQLLDTGNLVLNDEHQDVNNMKDFIWQSFDHPGDNLLHGMKFGIDLVSGIDRTGPVNGYKFTGLPKTSPGGIFKDTFVINKKEIYYMFDLINETSAVMRFVLTLSGVQKLLLWNYQQQSWMVYINLLVTDCDRYRLCGAYGRSTILISIVSITKNNIL
ncbi:hypothetical protein POM88_037827 [Heracleum sosnowskyi]|uniref:S-locus glycoprotein domain-containing protein n=1 Tax=Heracleum sosnowskyi TaxID=360622 RepID=A0AAD8HQY4_9APIA|nr:hypothetical protein POM88_037827 [Heracleum sosnowskyi]